MIQCSVAHPNSKCYTPLHQESIHSLSLLSPWPLRGLRRQSHGTSGSTPPLPAIPVFRHAALLSPRANSLQLLRCRREQTRMVGREAVQAACFRISLHMHLPKEQKEDQCQEKTTEMKMQGDRGGLRASQRQGAGRPRAGAAAASRYLQDAGHGAPPTLPPPGGGRARVSGGPGGALEAGAAAGPLQPTFPQLQIRGPRCALRGHRPRPPSSAPPPAQSTGCGPARPRPRSRANRAPAAPLGARYFLFSL